MRLCAALLGASILVPSLAAQQPAEHSSQLWFHYVGDHAVSERWGAHFDAQHRFDPADPDSWFSDLRPGVSFRVADGLGVQGGYAYLRSQRHDDVLEDEALSDEHRLYQQAAVSTGGETVGLNHRVRLEQRYFGLGRAAEHRFRYQFQTELPLGASRYSLVASDEILLNLGANAANRAFGQNRLYTAIGWDAGAPGKLEIGYMHRLNPRAGGRPSVTVHTLRMTWSSKLRLR